MLPSNYNYRQFIDTYREPIGYMISQVKAECKIKGYKIKDEKNLFKHLMYIIFIHSDKRKLTY